MVLCSELAICSEADVALARYRSGEAATLLGLSAQRRAEVRLIASELAHNHLDHKTCSGMIRCSGQVIDKVPVLTIASMDDGPGIVNVAKVLHGTAGKFISDTGLGAGLSSVSRLSNRFLCCSGRDPATRCPVVVPPVEGTVIVAQIWPEGGGPFFSLVPGMDFSALVCPQAETRPCGDGIFVHADNRFIRLVMVDSPGKGRGRGETELIGDMLEQFDLIWPPDHVVESLTEIFIAEPATSIAVVRFDRLREELRCCRVGSIGFSLLLDGRPEEKAPAPLQVHTGHLLHGMDTLYPVRESFCCLLHSDGVTGFPAGQLPDLLRELSEKETLHSGAASPHAEIVAQVLLSRYRNPADDAALCLWSWQRS